MLFDVITIFPDMFPGPVGESVLGSALERGLIEVRAHDLRTWTHDRHRTVDDYPYGGGPGMVMKAEPLFEALDAVQELEEEAGTVVFFTPSGVPFTQAIARDLATRERLVLVCGRYEGFDERALTRADVELSIGDYVLTGGELPAMVVIDAVARLVPGVLGHENSTEEESFSDGLLEYPQYTRPPELCGMAVPDVLRSGDHAAIQAWRREQALRKTARVRSDLLQTAVLSADESAIVEDELDAGNAREMEGTGE